MRRVRYSRRREISRAAWAIASPLGPPTFSMNSVGILRFAARIPKPAPSKGLPINFRHGLKRAVNSVIRKRQRQEQQQEIGGPQFGLAHCYRIHVGAAQAVQGGDCSLPKIRPDLAVYDLTPANLVLTGVRALVICCFQMNDFTSTYPDVIRCKRILPRCSGRIRRLRPAPGT